MKATAFLSLLAVAAITAACSGNTPASTDSNESAKVSATDCDVTLSNIHFTKCLNGADTLASEKDGIITFRATQGQDFFCDPSGSEPNLKAPILLTQVDNTKPFTLQAKITPQFTQSGTYNAGVLYLYENDAHWQKFCFEQDERGNHRVVTVRTIGTSDDNNSEVITGQDHVYYKISSDTKRVGFYFSRDGKTWTMVRLYKNDYPAQLLVGISNQCPKDEKSTSQFAELKLEHKAISDFRLGE